MHYPYQFLDYQILDKAQDADIAEGKKEISISNFLLLSWIVGFEKLHGVKKKNLEGKDFIWIKYSMVGEKLGKLFTRRRKEAKSPPSDAVVRLHMESLVSSGYLEKKILRKGQHDETYFHMTQKTRNVFQEDTNTGATTPDTLVVQERSEPEDSGVHNSGTMGYTSVYPTNNSGVHNSVPRVVTGFSVLNNKKEKKEELDNSRAQVFEEPEKDFSIFSSQNTATQEEATPVSAIQETSMATQQQPRTYVPLNFTNMEVHERLPKFAETFQRYVGVSLVGLNSTAAQEIFMRFLNQGRSRDLLNYCQYVAKMPELKAQYFEAAKKGKTYQLSMTYIRDQVDNFVNNIQPSLSGSLFEKQNVPKPAPEAPRPEQKLSDDAAVEAAKKLAELRKGRERRGTAELSNNQKRMVARAQGLTPETPTPPRGKRSSLLRLGELMSLKKGLDFRPDYLKNPQVYSALQEEESRENRRS